MHTRDIPVPRLPVLSWNYLFYRRDSPIPSVLAAPYRQATTSGRAAIALALREIGCKAGDTVLVPTYHCPTMVAPIVAFGGHAEFFPIDEQGNARLDLLPVATLERARAAIVPHYFGLPRQLSAIRSLCDRHHIALIEDCAHAFFGRSEGRPIGASGDYAIASLTKFFPVTEGGCLVSYNRNLGPLALAERPASASLKVLADALELGVGFRRLPGLNSVLGALFGAKRRLRRSDVPPRESNSHSPLQDAVLRAQHDFAPGTPPFSKIARSAWAIVRAGGSKRTVCLRQANYRWLAARLSNLRNARPLHPECSDDAAPYVFPLWVDNGEAVYQDVRRAGIPVFRWDDRWPGTPELDGDYGKLWSEHVFQIGCHQDLSRDDMNRFADALERIIDGSPS